MRNRGAEKKILLVEDDASLLRGLVDKFTREGFEVLSGANGAEGLVIARENHPNIILLDIMMDNMDGIDMLQELRSSGDWGRSVPVIFLTNLKLNVEKIKGYLSQHKPAFYFIKSEVFLKDIVARVNECLAADLHDRAMTGERS